VLAFTSLHVGIMDRFRRSEKNNKRKRAERKIEEERKGTVQRCFPVEDTTSYFPNAETGPRT
jgi:hypothetical protein